MADATNERGYIMFRLDQETALKRVYDPYTEDIQYKELSADITYSNGSHDGLQFVLKAIAGQEVIEL